ncbi:GTPase [Fistulifera solaris]|uniref:GTPase n=1 Tax=Fistulifera solaris TaxID=1519565 RepID=A0A1Z5JPJ0_FISSO|nr:GTPase [Fistulifera solaris]|eukprot:GAX15924.1 GTPase [Fistulifera solaris]
MNATRTTTWPLWIVRTRKSTQQSPKCRPILCRSFSTNDDKKRRRRRRRRLDIAIVGLPNAGKSQILNVLTKSRISAVSPKRHTTVQTVLGARTLQNTQLLFVDTPGFLRHDDAVDRDLMTSTAQVSQVDFTLLVVDAARRLTTDVQESLVRLMLLALQTEGRFEVVFENDDSLTIAEATSIMKPKFAVVLNKVDLVYPKVELLDVAMEIGSLAEECIWYHYLEQQQQQEAEERNAISLPKRPSMEQIVSSSSSSSLSLSHRTPQQHDTIILPQMPMFFYVSALARDKDPGMQDLLQFLLDEATDCDEWELDSSEQTNLSPEERVTEIVREQLYRALHQELPYQLRQKNRFWYIDTDPNTGLPRRIQIWQDILVMTASHRDIVRGHQGRTLEHIRRRATKELQKLFQCTVVDLQLHVKLPKSKQQRRSRDWSIE